jgi:hypothetical protein
LGLPPNPLSRSSLTALVMICVFSMILLDLYPSPDN